MPETETVSRCSMQAERIRIALATEQDRAAIYRLRHSVYAAELRQHPENSTGELTDSLDAFNLYVVASLAGEIAGFVSLTPPGRSYSIDKYLPRADLPFSFDDGLYEVRLLTVLPQYRHSTLGAELAGLLVYAAFRLVERLGARRVVVIGRREVVGLYRKFGLLPLGREIQSGAVTFELMSATADEMRGQLPRYADLIRYVEPRVDWRLDIPYYLPSACAHGGAFFEAVGVEFDHLERRQTIINADVLDAWFPPAPSVTAALGEHLPWLIGTSPPADAAGLIRTIARVRGVPADCVLPGAGSSALIFLALCRWLTPASRVLLLDPTYGEYLHVCRQVVGCGVDRLLLRREDGYRLDPAALEARLSTGYDLVVLVNPNNPTGQHVRREALEAVLQSAPERTRIWVDEAYVDYIGAEQSLERFAVRTSNVAVCKSLSKGFALSGARAAYLCACPALLEDLRRLTPPWAVSLPAQVAAVLALQAPDYYAARYRETHLQRERLVEGLQTIDPRLEVFDGTANFVFCHLPEDGPDAATFVSRCQGRGLFLRDVNGTGTALGRHAIRIAVKDEEVQKRMLEVLGQVLRT